MADNDLSQKMNTKFMLKKVEGKNNKDKSGYQWHRKQRERKSTSLKTLKLIVKTYQEKNERI